MTNDLIAQAEAALDGVTPGPWTVVERQAEDDPDETALDMLDGRGRRVMSHGDGYYASVPDREDWPFIAWCRAGVPALIARIRELEGERDNFANLYDEGLAWVTRCREEHDRAEAAEAKLAEVEKERAKLEIDLATVLAREANSFVRHDAKMEAAEATVANLKEQVEAMRVSAMKAMTIANGALDPTATEKTFRRDLVQIREELRGALWPAAITTENQNG